MFTKIVKRLISRTDVGKIADSAVWAVNSEHQYVYHIHSFFSPSLLSSLSFLLLLSMKHIKLASQKYRCTMYANVCWTLKLLLFLLLNDNKLTFIYFFHLSVLDGCIQSNDRKNSVWFQCNGMNGYCFNTNCFTFSDTYWYTLANQFLTDDDKNWLFLRLLLLLLLLLLRTALSCSYLYCLLISFCVDMRSQFFVGVFH